MTELARTADGAIRVLDILEGGTGPMVGRRGPLWLLPTSPSLRAIISGVLTPRFGWESGREVAPGTLLVDVDANASYLSAASSVRVGHTELKRTGALDYIMTPRPGYYLVDSHYWGHKDQLSSPLGDRKEGGLVWVTQPTLTLLLELVDSGHWPHATVHDSWTSEVPCRLDRTWTNPIRDLRQQFIISGDEEGYEALKFGYSQAIIMLGMPYDPKGTPKDQVTKKNRYYRPDWKHTIMAQSSATLWRRAWHTSLAGFGPLRIGNVDALTYTLDDLQGTLGMVKPPLKINDSSYPHGPTLGAYTMSEPYPAGEGAK
jgi:hypothetical protein